MRYEPVSDFPPHRAPGISNVNTVLTLLRSQPDTKPPLLLVITWSLVAAGLWILINRYAGRLVWWW